MITSVVLPLFEHTSSGDIVCMAQLDQPRTSDDLKVLCRMIAGTIDRDIGTLIESHPRLLRTAERHFVLSALGSAPGAPAPGVDPVGIVVAGAAVLNVERNRKILSGLETALSALDRAGFQPVLLKGAAHIASGLWPAPGARMLRDVDLLLSADEVRGAWEFLVDTEGFRPVAEPARGRIAVQRHLPPLTGPLLPVSLELHHATLPQRRKALLPGGDVIDGARSIRVGRRHALIPAPEARALMALAHGPVGTGTWAAPQIFLRDLLDLVFLARNHAGDIDWERVAAHCEAANWAFLPAWANRVLPEFAGVPSPFSRTTLFGRIDARRWRRQLDLAPAVRLGRLGNMSAAGLRALVAGGSRRRRAIDTLRRPVTFRRAGRRYILGKDNNQPENAVPRMTCIPITAKTVLRRTELLSTEAEMATFFMNLETGQYLMLQETGRRIWELIDGNVPVQRIVARLLDEYQVDPVTCLTDTLHFAEELRTYGAADVVG